MSYLAIFLTYVFINNFILVQFLGLCPFIGVSKNSESAIGMGLALTFVTGVTSVVCWIVYHGVLVPLGLEYLETITFILIIAALVQFVEIVLKKVQPGLYKSLGIFLPLITTNCAVLGVAVINMNEKYSFKESIVHAAGASVGFLLAILLMAGIRERIEISQNMPKCLRGLPIALVTAGLMSIAFMGFSGLIK